MNSVDPKIKSALEKDPHNPNAPKTAAQSGFSASTAGRPGGARSSLRDRIAADKRAAKQQPARPVTAMASMSPSKSKSMANLNAAHKAQAAATPVAVPHARVASNLSVASNATTKSVESMSSSTSASTTRPNSLMSGAARRPVKRPELARPQTADPYATRKLLRPETPSNQSPSNSPRQTTTARPNAATSTVTRNRVGRNGSPAASPLRQQPGTRSFADSTSAGSVLTPSDDATMVMHGGPQREAPLSLIHI